MYNYMYFKRTLLKGGGGPVNPIPGKYLIMIMPCLALMCILAGLNFCLKGSEVK